MSAPHSPRPLVVGGRVNHDPPGRFAALDVVLQGVGGVTSRAVLQFLLPRGVPKELAEVQVVTSTSGLGQQWPQSEGCEGWTCVHHRWSSRHPCPPYRGGRVRGRVLQFAAEVVPEPTSADDVGDVSAVTMTPTNSVGVRRLCWSTSASVFDSPTAPRSGSWGSPPGGLVAADEADTEVALESVIQGCGCSNVRSGAAVGPDETTGDHPHGLLWHPGYIPMGSGRLHCHGVRRDRRFESSAIPTRCEGGEAGVAILVGEADEGGGLSEHPLRKDVL